MLGVFVFLLILQSGTEKVWITLESEKIDQSSETEVGYARGG